MIPKYMQFWKGKIAGNLIDSIYRNHLDDLQRKLLIAFAIYREAVVLEAGEVILEGIVSFSNLQIQSALDTLLAQNLLQASGENFYHMQTLVKVYAQARLMEGDEQFNLPNAHYQAAKYYLQRNPFQMIYQQESERI